MISDLKETARRLMRDNSPKLFFVGILFIALTTLMAQLQVSVIAPVIAWQIFLEDLAAGALPSLAEMLQYFRPTAVPIYIVLWVLSVILNAGYVSYCLKISRKSEADYKTLFDGFLFFGKIILVNIMTYIFILLWSLLFIIPGFVASYRYRLAVYILLDHPEKGVLQCIRESKAIMRGKKLDLFLVDLSFIGWLILNSFVVLLIPLPIPLPLVMIWVAPYIGLTCAGYYNRLVENLAA